MVLTKCVHRPQTFVKSDSLSPMDIEGHHYKNGTNTRFLLIKHLAVDFAVDRASPSRVKLLKSQFLDFHQYPSHFHRKFTHELHLLDSTKKSTMKAVVIAEPGKSEVRDIAEPSIRPDYIKVKTIALAVNSSTCYPFYVLSVHLILTCVRENC